MRTDRDYYRILGVERQATSDQIKQRYRELVRQYHPDVNPNQNSGLGQHTFLMIVEAYQLLSDPEKRKEYDKVWERRLTHASTRTQPGSPPPSGAPIVIENLLAEARRYHQARNATETVRTCRRILQLDKENPAAYEMMGDVYAGLKRNEEAISYYTMAQQFSKGDTTALTVKIDRLMRREQQHIREQIQGKPVYKRAPAMILITLTMLMMAGWGFSLRGGETVQGFMLFSQTPVLALFLFWLDSFLLGAALAGGDQIGRYDDEMLFDLTAGPVSGNAPPLGVFLPVISIINFFLAMVTYAVYAVNQEKFSPSVAKAGLILLLLAMVFAAPHPDAMLQMLVFGTGPGFAIMCGGWLLADALRPHW